MDIHKNARTTPHSRAVIARRVSGPGSRRSSSSRLFAGTTPRGAGSGSIGWSMPPRGPTRTPACVRAGWNRRGVRAQEHDRRAERRGRQEHGAPDRERDRLRGSAWVARGSRSDLHRRSDQRRRVHPPSRSGGTGGCTRSGSGRCSSWCGGPRWPSGIAWPRWACRARPTTAGRGGGARRETAVSWIGGQRRAQCGIGFGRPRKQRSGRRPCVSPTAAPGSWLAG